MDFRVPPLVWLRKTIPYHRDYAALMSSIAVFRVSRRLCRRLVGREEYLLELPDLKDPDKYPPLLGASIALFYRHHTYGGG